MVTSVAILYACTVIWCAMEKMVKLRHCGIEEITGYVDQALDLSLPGYLEVKDTDSQGRHRLMKIARFIVPSDEPGKVFRRDVMLDVEMGNWRNGRVRIRGIERFRNEHGQIVEYRQEWLVQTGIVVQPPPGRRPKPI